MFRRSLRPGVLPSRAAGVALRDPAGVLPDPLRDLGLRLHRTLHRGERLGRIGEAHVLAGGGIVDEADGEKQFDHGLAPLRWQVRREADRRAWAPFPRPFLALVAANLRCAGADANEEEVQSLFRTRHRGISRASLAEAATQWPIPALQTA
jgi:hypothetical protein